MASWEADAGIVAVAFHSCTLNEVSEVSGSVPSPDVGGKSPGVSRVGSVLLPEGEVSRFSLGWAAMLWSRAGREP